MKLKIVVVDLELSPATKRLAIFSGIALSAIVLAGAVPYTFSTGDVLSSKAVNDDFANLDSRISSGRTVVTNDAGVSYSVGYTLYCGATAAVTGAITSGSKTGYAGAKAQCETVPGCSPSAHMCSSEEIVRTTEMGTITASGWIATGVVAPVTGPVDDCQGWTIGDNTQQAGAWTGNFMGWVPCNTPEKILCCD